MVRYIDILSGTPLCIINILIGTPPCIINIFSGTPICIIYIFSGTPYHIYIWVLGHFIDNKIMDRKFHRQDISQKKIFIDKILWIRHFINRTFHRQDISQIRHFKDRKFHRQEISQIEHFIDIDISQKGHFTDRTFQQLRRFSIYRGDFLFTKFFFLRFFIDKAKCKYNAPKYIATTKQLKMHYI